MAASAANTAATSLAGMAAGMQTLETAPGAIRREVLLEKRGPARGPAPAVADRLDAATVRRWADSPRCALVRPGRGRLVPRARRPRPAGEREGAGHDDLLAPAPCWGPARRGFYAATQAIRDRRRRDSGLPSTARRSRRLDRRAAAYRLASRLAMVLSITARGSFGRHSGRLSGRLSGRPSGRALPSPPVPRGLRRPPGVAAHERGLRAPGERGCSRAPPHGRLREPVLLVRTPRPLESAARSRSASSAHPPRPRFGPVTRGRAALARTSAPRRRGIRAATQAV